MHSPAAITTIVVCRNEAAHLRQCLPLLRWTDELIVIDLGSTDGSRAIAEQWADRVYDHVPSPIVEPVRQFGAERATHDWLLFVDPDERYSRALADDVREAAGRYADAAIVYLPMHYYFKGRRLTCTAWGKDPHYRPALVHRRRCVLQSDICRGFAPREGFTTRTVEPTDANTIQHFWMASYRQFIAKHWRYARCEGEARWRRQVGSAFDGLMRQPLRELRRNLVERGGLRGGSRGVLLSLGYSAYLFLSAAWQNWFSLTRRATTDSTETHVDTTRRARRAA